MDAERDQRVSMVTKGLPLDPSCIFKKNWLNFRVRGQFEIKLLIVPGHSDINTTYFISSSETQGQIVGARESLNGGKNVARRKVKNGEKSPRGSSRPSPFFTFLRSIYIFPVPKASCKLHEVGKIEQK